MSNHRYYIIVAAAVIFSTFLCNAQDAYVLNYSFGSFKNAQRLSLDAFNHIYVTDAGTNTLSRFQVDGSKAKTIGGVGWNQDQFDRPGGIDAGFGLQIYVADFGNHRIQQFDGNLNYVGTFTTHDDADPNVRFGYPVDVAISRLGEMYIIDSENNRIVKVNTQSQVERTFGSIEAGSGQLTNPHRIHIGSDDNIYVLEKNRLIVFDPFGSYRYSLGDGIIAAATGFCFADDMIFIVSDESFIALRTDGSLLRKIGWNEFLGVQSLKDIHDVAANANSIFILTSTQVHVFRKPT